MDRLSNQVELARWCGMEVLRIFCRFTQQKRRYLEEMQNGPNVLEYWKISRTQSNHWDNMKA